MKDIITWLLDMLEDKPGKFSRLLLITLDVFFMALLTNWLYVKLVGPYELISWKDTAALYQFLIRGTWLLVLFSFCLTYAIFFFLMPEVISFLVQFTASRASKTQDDGLMKSINSTLFFLKFAKKGEQGAYFIWTDSSNDLLKALDAYHKDGGNDRLRHFEHTFVMEIIYTSILFLVGYLICEPFPYSPKLNAIVFSCFIVLLFIYLFIAWGIRTLSAAATPYYKLFTYLHLQNTVIEKLQDLRIPVISTNEKKAGTKWCLALGEKKHAIVLRVPGIPLIQKELENYKEFSANETQTYHIFQQGDVAAYKDLVNVSSYAEAGVTIRFFNEQEGLKQELDGFLKDAIFYM
jgi:hypothetical protein